MKMHNVEELNRRIGEAIGDDRDRLHVGDEYRHREGGAYVLLGVALEERTCEPVAMYRSLLTGIAWTRPAAEFRERFAWIGPQIVGDDDGEG